jgi:Glu-tRNA(Gln) amidotransferase subunit E-like FAD-binding protein
MARSDSICLTFDVHDSLLILELEGVAIHQAKVSQVTMSPVFNKMHRSALVQLFDTPFRVDSCRATIIKEPIIAQKAPADTIEAARQETVRDTMPPPPATYHLYLNKDITLIIVQADEIDKKNEIYRQFVKTSLQRKVGNIIRNLARFKVPDYRPWIMMFVEQDDAITIYRAIPYHSLVSIRI